MTVMYGLQHVDCGHVCAVAQSRFRVESVMGGLHSVGLHRWRTRRLDGQAMQESAVEALLTSTCTTCTVDPALIAEAAPELAAYLDGLRETDGG